MASRLSELLDRIRPAGTPGAPSDLISQHEQATADELAQLTVALARLGEEADGIVADARARAEQIRAGADRRIERIRADLPERLAAAEALGVASPTPDVDAELARWSEDTQREVDRLRIEAGPRLDRLVERATSVVWNLLSPSGSVEVEQ